MTLTIQSSQINTGSPVYYEEAWHLLIETHLPFLIADQASTTFTVTPIDAYRFEGDLMGLLLAYSIQPQYHWIVMRMNGLRSPQEYRQNTLTMLTPDSQRIDALRKAYMTISNKTN